MIGISLILFHLSFGLLQTSSIASDGVSSLPGAPHIHRADIQATAFARKAMNEWMKDVYLRNGDPCPICMVHFSFYDAALRHIDYSSIEKGVRLRLSAAGKKIAFDGLSSDELLITTAPTGQIGKMNYYQVSIITDYCGEKEVKNPCDVSGSARKLLILSSKTTHPATDTLSQDIEDYLSKYFYQLLTDYSKQK